MRSYLSISHLIRHFLLFVLTALFLLTITRAGYSLWQLDKFADTPTLLQSFGQGIRFDAAAIGMLLIVPVIVIPLLSMFGWSLGLARFLSLTWFMLALAFVLLSELITPHFLQNNQLRPDLNLLSSTENPTGLIMQTVSGYPIPSLIGIVLFLLIMIAFWKRLEVSRFLRYPVKIFPALLLSLMGVAICVVLIRSDYDLRKPALDVSASLISTEPMVNEISLCTPYKLLWTTLANNGFLQTLLSTPAK